MRKIIILGMAMFSCFAIAETQKPSLDSVIKQLSEKDKAVVEQIKQQVINWPDNVFKEVQAYRSFVMSSRKQAEAMQKNLSNEAQEAIKIEKEFKAKLSPEAIKLLSTLE